jgi:hypothetical protein
VTIKAKAAKAINLSMRFSLQEIILGHACSWLMAQQSLTHVKTKGPQRHPVAGKEKRSLRILVDSN